MDATQSHSPDATGYVLGMIYAIFYGLSLSDLDKFFLTPFMHFVTICVGLSSLYFLFKPKKKES